MLYYSDRKKKKSVSFLHLGLRLLIKFSLHWTFFNFQIGTIPDLFLVLQAGLFLVY